MNKLTKTLIVLLALFAVTGLYGKVSADTSITFSEDPLFDVSNFVPGDEVRANIEIRNNDASPRDAYIEGVNVLNADNLARQMRLEILEGTTTIYSDNFETFLSAGQVLLSNIQALDSKTFELKVTFLTSAPNDNQYKSLVFDICVGFSNGLSHCTGDLEVSTTTEPTITPPIGGVGGGGGSSGGGGGPGFIPGGTELAVLRAQTETVGVGYATATQVPSTSGSTAVSGEEPPLFDVRAEPVQISESNIVLYLTFFAIGFLLLLLIILYIMSRAEDHIDKKNKMKWNRGIAILCFTVSAIGLFEIHPVSAAELYPPEATAALGEIGKVPPALFDVGAEPTGARVDTTSTGLSTRIAPGEILPVSVKLLNFGGVKRVDVLVHYGIYASDESQVSMTNETVAVETTASFVKTLQIPFDALPGIYTVKTYITYEGQLVPASTQFPFMVERKIAGFFLGDFVFYGSIILAVIILILLLCYLFMKDHMRAKVRLLDYSEVPHIERTFYEIISDTIVQMRQRVGDQALVIASSIHGLKIDVETGRVLKLTDRPAKIITELVSKYEELLGKKVSFSFRPKK